MDNEGHLVYENMCFYLEMSHIDVGPTVLSDGERNISGLLARNA